jgi:hypothetical protein
MFYGNKTTISSVTSVTIGQFHRERPLSVTDWKLHFDLSVIQFINKSSKISTSDVMMSVTDNGRSR